MQRPHQAEFEQTFGMSLQQIASYLGGEITVAIDGPLVPVPAWKFVAEVKDAQGLQSALAKMRDVILGAGEAFAKQIGKDGTDERGDAKSEEVNSAGRAALDFVRIDFLDDRVRNHGRAGGDAKNQTADLRREVTGAERDQRGGQ